MFLGKMRAPQAGVVVTRGSGRAQLLPRRPVPLMTVGSSQRPFWGLVSPICKMGMRTPLSRRCCADWMKQFTEST